MNERHDSTSHDVVVVGARCAGSATAMLLARAGHDVVVVDRAAFPSDTLSTHAISRSGVVQLHRWGLLDRVLATGAPAIRQVSFHIGGDVVVRQIKDRAGVDHLVNPRRFALDTVLVEAAGEAGADVRTGMTVTDVLRQRDGRTTGVVVRGEDGKERCIRSRFVVGADGLKSRVARAVGAPFTDERHSNGAVHYTYVAGLDAEGTEFHLSDRRFAGVFPTNDGEANVWVCGPAASVGTLGRGSDRRAAFLEQVAGVSPSLAARIEVAEITAPIRGYVGMPNQIRQPVGPGWALVGDASYFRDAVTGHGITDAFRDAEMLAHTLDDVLRGVRPEAEALAAHHARRDELVAELFEITVELATYPPVARFVELQKQLSNAIEAEAELLSQLPPIPGADARAA